MAGEGANGGLRDAGAGVGPDEALAAAKVEPGGGALVGHGAGETEDVGEGVLLGGVGPDADAAEGGTEGGVVDTDEGPEAGALVDGNQELLVVAGLQGVDDVHR